MSYRRRGTVTKLEAWLLKRICKRIIKQGYFHKHNLIYFYMIMTEAAHKEFSEDNNPTLRCFLKECHGTALNTYLPVGDAYQ